MARERASHPNRVLFAGYVCLGLAVLLIVIAFSTPNWLTADERLYGLRFQKLGLWEQCFRSIINPNEIFDGNYFTGCRFLFNPWTTGYDRLREDFIMKPFFIFVQVFFTLCLIFSIISCVLVLIYALCSEPDQDPKLLRSISIINICGAICGAIAVITFGSNAYSRDWMPDPEHNYLGWSYALAVIGSFLLCVCVVLFFIEGRRVAKHDRRGDPHMFGQQHHQTTKA